jgi:hypothetical protein
MLFHQLQPLLLPGALVALALIGLGLLRSEIQTSRRRREQKREGVLKVVSSKKRFRKAS